MSHSKFQVRLSSKAQQDIRDMLLWSFDRFGPMPLSATTVFYRKQLSMWRRIPPVPGAGLGRNWA